MNLDTRPDAEPRPARIVFCIDNFGIGGTELNAVRTAERLDRSRIELRVISLQEDGPLRSRYEAAGIPIVSLPISNLWGIHTLRQGLRLRSMLREWRIDILHAHDIYTNVFGIPWARLAGVRTIASRRWWANEPLSGLESANRVAYRIADRVLANSPRVARFSSEADGVPTDRVAVVPNFLDEHAWIPPTPEQRGALLRDLDIPEGSPVVGSIANLSPVKDHASLLKAVANISRRWPDLVVVLVGDGACRGPLEALAGELDIRRHIRFAGRRINRPNLHHLFDVSVLCSVSEGLPNSILEAMAAGRPVVATEVGANPDAVVDGETGLLVAPSDPVGLGQAIDRLLSEPELARSMGAAGRRRARKTYSAESALSSLERLYNELCRSGSPGIRRQPRRVAIGAGTGG